MWPDRSGAGWAAAAGRVAAAGLATACAVLPAAGCASSHPPEPAVANPVAPSTRALAAKYLAIARPANGQLDHDFNGLAANENKDLAAAQADLRNAAATERRFDRQLIAITFPPRTEPIVRLLYDVNQARAALTDAAAASVSLRQLQGYQPRLDAANQPVEDAGKVIRSQLGLPPPETS
jgi:hypothetical protein